VPWLPYPYPWGAELITTKSKADDLGHLSVTLEVGDIVVIGDVRVRISKVDRDRVRLLVEAPRSMPIHRAMAPRGAA